MASVWNKKHVYLRRRSRELRKHSAADRVLTVRGGVFTSTAIPPGNLKSRRFELAGQSALDRALRDNNMPYLEQSRDKLFVPPIRGQNQPLPQSRFILAPDWCVAILRNQ